MGYIKKDLDRSYYFMRILILLLISLIFVVAYLRYFEKKCIYYPTAGIERTPGDVGLRYEDVSFNVDDGPKLNGWFIPAEGARAVILYCHGNAGNISHRIEIIKILNSLKLDIFIFDYRGYGRSEGSPSEKGLYRDARAAYNYLVSREDVARERIVVYGESIGGNIAIDLASKVEVAALISESAFSSAYDMGKILFPYLPVGWLITIKYDAMSAIKDVSIPKLIMHSRDDEIVPFDLGEKLYKAALEPKEFYEMRGSHNEAIYIATGEYKARIDAFLSRAGL